MFVRYPLLLGSSILLLAAVGCSGEGTTSEGAPTYHADIEPLLARHCQSCHSPGNIGPFSLVNYEQAKALAPAIVAATQSGSMPPFGAKDTDECQPRFGWKDDLRLSQAEIDRIAAWNAAGAPEGDPASAPAPFVPPEPGLPGAAMELTPKTPFVTSGDNDQFRCFVMDPALTGTKFIDGMHIVPGNPAVVHHALTFRAQRDDILPKVDADGGFECFGSPSGDLLHAWAPGAVPFVLDPGIGAELGPNHVFVTQIHYHPAGKVADPDATKLQVRFTEAEPKWAFQIGLIGNSDNASDGLMPGPNDNGGAEFRIPAGVKDHTETSFFVVPPLPGTDHAKLYMVGSHMHYVGTDMHIKVDRKATFNDDPESECLVQTPDWSFAWQRTYVYDTPIDALPQAHAGDVFTLRCTYDNTLENPDLKRALSEQGLMHPTEVRLGESTLDEMCLFVLGYLLPR